METFFLETESPMDLLLVVVLDDSHCLIENLEHGLDVLYKVSDSENFTKIALSDFSNDLDELLDSVYEWKRWDSKSAIKNKTIAAWIPKEKKIRK